MSVVDLQDTGSRNIQDQYSLTGRHPSDCSLCRAPLQRVSVYWSGEQNWPIPARAYPWIKDWHPEDVLLHPDCAEMLAYKAAQSGKVGQSTVARLMADAFIAQSIARRHPILRGVVPSLERETVGLMEYQPRTVMIVAPPSWRVPPGPNEDF